MIQEPLCRSRKVDCIVRENVGGILQRFRLPFFRDVFDLYFFIFIFHRYVFFPRKDCTAVVRVDTVTHFPDRSSGRSTERLPPPREGPEPATFYHCARILVANIPRIYRFERYRRHVEEKCLKY